MTKRKIKIKNGERKKKFFFFLLLSKIEQVEGP